MARLFPRGGIKSWRKAPTRSRLRPFHHTTTRSRLSPAISAAGNPSSLSTPRPCPPQQRRPLRRGRVVQGHARGVGDDRQRSDVVWESTRFEPHACTWASANTWSMALMGPQPAARSSSRRIHSPEDRVFSRAAISGITAPRSAPMVPACHTRRANQRGSA